MATFPEATPDNGYLGFCKAAWNLQNGDKKASFTKVRETLVAYSRSGSNNKTTTPYYLQCRESRCSFRSREVNPDVGLLWSRIFEYPQLGIKFRWSFLAKSHVPQRASEKAHSSFKCLFCVYSSRSAEVYGGMSSYLHHISAEHRGKDMSPVVEAKTRCINNRIARGHEDFDINLWPSTASGSVTSREWIHGPEDPDFFSRNLSVGSANDMYLEDVPSSAQFGDGSKASLDTAGEKAFITAEAERLFKPSSPSPNVNRRSPWDDVHTNPWAVDDPLRQDVSQPPAGKPPVAAQASPRNHEQVSQPQVSRSIPTASADLPVIPLSNHSQHRSSEHRLDMQEMQGAFEQAGPPNDAEDSLKECLDEIVAIFNDALAYVEEIKQHAHRTGHEPPNPMVVEVLRDAPVAIVKQRGRCLAQYGSTFEAADPHTVASLQRVVTRLGSKLLRPLRQIVAGSDSSGDYHALMREAESGQIKTTMILHERGECLHKQAADASKAYLSASPHNLRALHAAYSPSASRTPSYDLARHSQDDSHSAADSERQASTASTSSGSHQFEAQHPTACSRRRSSVLANLFKHGRRSSSEANLATQSDPSKAVAKRLEFRHKKSEGPYPPDARAAELDSTPVLQNG